MRSGFAGAVMATPTEEPKRPRLHPHRKAPFGAFGRWVRSRSGGRFLLRELRAREVGDVGRDEPGRVFDLRGASVCLAQVRSQHLRVDPNFVGERLWRDDVRCHDVVPFVRWCDHIVSCLAHRVCKIDVKCRYEFGMSTHVHPPAAPPRRTMLHIGRRLCRAKRAGREIFHLVTATYGGN